MSLTSLHSSLHLCSIRHAHAIGIDVLVSKLIWIWHTVQELSNALGMADGTILVAQE